MRLHLSVPPPDSSPFDFVAAGEGGIDLLARVPHLPQVDEKISCHGWREMSGGQAATAAVGVARLGWRSRWLGATGDDMRGRHLRDALAREGVDVAAPARIGAMTRSALVLVEESSGRRAIVESRDPALDVDPEEFDAATLRGGRITLVDGTNLRLSRQVARSARQAGMRTMVDVDRCDPGTMQLLAEIDVVIVPELLSRELTGAKTTGAAAAALGEELPSAAAVVVTLGAEGALGWCRGDEVHVPARQIAVRDTTGAGDAFRAGFAARWLESGDAAPEFPDLLEYATLVAALSSRYDGAQTGLPTRADVAAALTRRV